MARTVPARKTAKTGKLPLGGWIWKVLLAIVLAGAAYLYLRLTRDHPVDYADPVEHFKYGSTGGERDAGIPLSLWKALPDLFGKYLPGKGYESLGFLYEKGRDLPIGVSMRNVQGVNRVFLNCAVCHVGTVRDTPSSEPRIIVGMPANGLNLQKFQWFLFNCAKDEDFTPERLVDEIKEHKGEDGLNRLLFRYYAVSLARQRLLMLAQRFGYMDREPETGPGRVDTFNPPKVLMNFRMDNLPPEEWVGNCDLPSVWNQERRKRMQLHWDGNNNSLDERNLSASFGTGATPPTLDEKSLARMRDYLMTATPPAWPYGVDTAKAARGQKIYQATCAKCHGQSGTDFSGEYVGKVTPIDKIRTDRHRLDSYSETLCVNQNLLYAGYPEQGFPARFSHFHKTNGYANMPLDGLWLRGPYLHNGSVPTLRGLLEPSVRRPKVFYRGYDVIDRTNVGFISSVAEEKGKKYFKYDTDEKKFPGNGNHGHEGPEYGTSLSPQDKDALVEYLKTF